VPNLSDVVMDMPPHEPSLPLLYRIEDEDALGPLPTYEATTLSDEVR
jgi:hypothetical protein